MSAVSQDRVPQCKQNTRQREYLFITILHMVVDRTGLLKQNYSFTFRYVFHILITSSTPYVDIRTCNWTAHNNNKLVQQQHIKASWHGSVDRASCQYCETCDGSKSNCIKIAQKLPMIISSLISSSYVLFIICYS